MTDDPQGRMDRMKVLVASLARELSLFPSLPEHRADVVGHCDPTACGLEKTRLTTAKAWVRANAVRRQKFKRGDSLFSDPAWEILLDLYIQGAAGRSVTVSSACIASGVPPTTGLRWLARLTEEGLIERKPADDDNRKILVSLTEAGLDQMEAALDAAIAGDRRLGLERMSFS